MIDAMTPAQRAVAEQVVAEEIDKRETLVLALWGPRLRVCIGRQ